MQKQRPIAEAKNVKRWKSPRAERKFLLTFFLLKKSMRAARAIVKTHLIAVNVFPFVVFIFLLSLSIYIYIYRLLALQYLLICPCSFHLVYLSCRVSWSHLRIERYVLASLENQAKGATPKGGRPRPRLLLGRVSTSDVHLPVSREGGGGRMGRGLPRASAGGGAAQISLSLSLHPTLCGRKDLRPFVASPPCSWEVTFGVFVL